ncbi:hypothetical protein [Paraburkholderia sp. LEh10]|uniref:hypothetical protein n=1 Tax=Paraburkholderia sp. LEh10 TaxID=2821353 RepID=UPI001FD7413A|nr:hypothetical protein [Paraburkholderia sp. LEh10]
MKKHLAVLMTVALIASSCPEGIKSASPPLRTLPLQGDIWLAGTLQRGSRPYAPDDHTASRLDRPSTSPCNDKVVTDILLGEGGSPAPRCCCRT